MKCVYEFRLIWAQFKMGRISAVNVLPGALSWFINSMYTKDLIR